jgi:hypothetical protein
MRKVLKIAAISLTALFVLGLGISIAFPQKQHTDAAAAAAQNAPSAAPAGVKMGAADAHAKASVEHALWDVASDDEDFHTYDLVSAVTLKNIDPSLRAVTSLQANGSTSTFTVSVRSASGTTFELMA